MTIVERVLMGPGPSNPYPEVMAALARPVVGTSNTLTLPVSGSGSAGMEAALVNLVGAGDVVVVGVNGLFGERLCDVAGRCGAEVVRVDEEWGRAIEPERLLAAHPSPAVIAVVHA